LNNVAGHIADANGKSIHEIFGHWHEEVFCGNDQTAKCIWRQSMWYNKTLFFRVNLVVNEKRLVWCLRSSKTVSLFC
jgi:hypothetical protein